MIHPLENSNFKNFISSVLEIRGGVKPPNIAKIVNNSKNMEIFRRAFTHRSAYPLKSYEKSEFIGDTIVNAVVANYIRKKFPFIETEKWMTGVKHKLISSKTLAQLSIAAGYDKYLILRGKALVEKNEMPDPYSNEKYLAVLEDVFEAFIGAIGNIIDDTFNEGKMGPGISVAENIISSHLNEIKISLNYAGVFDPVTRLKEIYDRRAWNFNASHKTEDNPDGGKHTTIWGYVLGNQKQGRENRKELVKNVWGQSKASSRQNAAEKALMILESSYNITDLRTGPTDIPKNRKDGL